MAFQILNVVSVVLIDIYLMKVLKKITAVHAEKIGILFFDIIFSDGILYIFFVWKFNGMCVFNDGYVL